MAAQKLGFTELPVVVIRNLSDAQKRLIPEFLWHGPEAYGFRGEVWTCGRVAQVLKEEWGVEA